MELYKPFRFWCQKVLPLVYDDSLSYYELLCKVVNYLNNIIGDTNTLIEEYEELKKLINEYFNENVQEAVDNKLDQMALDGTLDNIMEKYVDGHFLARDRKIVGITNTLNKLANNDRVSHMRINKINKVVDSEGNITDYQIRFTRGLAPFTFSVNPNFPNYLGLLYAIRGMRLQRNDLYLDNVGTSSINDFMSLKIYANGTIKDPDDFNVNDEFTDLFFVKRQAENKYIITACTADGLHIFLNYDTILPTYTGKYCSIVSMTTGNLIETLNVGGVQINENKNTNKGIIKVELDVMEISKWHRIDIFM